MQPSSRSTSFFIAVLAVVVAGAFMLLVPSCSSSVNALSSDGGGASTGTGGFGGIDGGKIPVGMTQCSDGIDNGMDGKTDYDDPECVGPWDNDESSFATGIPGDNKDACKQDCFFDGNYGAGAPGTTQQPKQSHPFGTSLRQAVMHACDCDAEVEHSVVCEAAYAES